MADHLPAAEYKALQQNYCKLVEAVTQGKIPGTLFEKGLIDINLLLQPSGDTPREYGSKLMKQILTSVNLKPKDNFDFLCQALEAESVANEILEQVKSKCSS